MTTMHEKLARAVELAIMRHGVAECDLEGTLDDATNILTTMLEPSDVMVDCASVAFEGEQMQGPLCNGRLPSENIFRAAIQAALDEVEEG